jgi:hypothetical protein
MGDRGGRQMLLTKALREIIGTKLERPVRDAINGFVCRDMDVESFLKNKAFELEKRHKSRTYLLLDNAKYLDGEIVLLAYFTLSLKSLEFRDTLSKTKIRAVDGFSKEVKGVAIALIGQFGKDKDKAESVPGEKLLAICMDALYQVHTLIGGRYVLIECRDIGKVTEFYRCNGFELLQTDKSDSYLQMVRRL